MATYQTTPVIINNEDPVVQKDNKTFSRAAKIGVSVLAVVAVLFVVDASSRSGLPAMSDAAGSIVSESSESTEVAPCTFDECGDSSCDHEAAPYVCLFHNGGPHGGCSSVPWVSWTCDKQCDLSDCDDLSIPEDTATCDDEPCDDAWCANGPRLCGSDVPYQCTGGAATFGCSDDTYMWTFKTSDASCGSCCNVNSCA